MNYTEFQRLAKEQLSLREKIFFGLLQSEELQDITSEAELESLRDESEKLLAEIVDEVPVAEGSVLSSIRETLITNIRFSSEKLEEIRRNRQAE